MTARGDWSRMVIANRLADLADVPAFVDGVAGRAGLGADCASRMNIVLDELLNNAISYGYPPGQPGRIEIALRVAGARFYAELTDDAAFFDPSTPPHDAAPALELGGLGLRFVRLLAPRISVERRGGLNVTKLAIDDVQDGN